MTLNRAPRSGGPSGEADRNPGDVVEVVGSKYARCELEQLGYLERRDDPEDKRSRRIELTERGYAVRRIMRESVARIEGDLQRELGRDKVDQLRTLLTALNGSAFVQDSRERTGQARLIAEASRD